MKYLNLILAAVLVGIVAVDAAQDTTFSQREVRDPRKLEAILEANAADAESRIASLEGGSTVGSVEPGYIIVGNASTQGVDVAVSGDITLSTAGVVAIASGVIVNADINAAAAIAHTKLAAVDPGYLLVGNASSQAVAVAVSGDVTMSNAGAVSFAAGTLSTNVIIDATYTNTIVLRTLSSGVIVVDSWTQDAVGE
jgi:hypothetical protein